MRSFISTLSRGGLAPRSSAAPVPTSRGALRRTPTPSLSPPPRRRVVSRGAAPPSPAHRRDTVVVRVASSPGGGAPSAAQPYGLTAVAGSAAVAALGAFLFGYHLAIVNGPLDAIAASLGFAGDAAKAGAVVSSLLVGATAGSLGGSPAADALGRKGALVVSAIPLLAGAVLCATAASLPALIGARAVAGVGIGLASALVPLYISEVAPARVRGALGSINQLVICIGILGALVANVALPPAGWRTMFAVAAIPAALLAAGMLAAPESPRWLAGRGRLADADAAARTLWGPAGPAELAASAAGAAAAKAAPASLAALAGARGVRVGCALFLFQQFAGINAIIYFSSAVFAKAGITNGAAASALVGAVNVAGTVAAASAMDRLGRRTLLSASFGGMAATMLAMAAGLGLPAFAGVAAPIALAGTVAYIAAFGAGVGPVPGVLASELAPASLRGAAVSAAMATHWVCNFAVGQLFLPAVARVGVAGVYLFFAAVCAAGLLFVRAAVPETKGRTLEEIEAMMG